MEPLSAGRDASSGVGVPPYVRHPPEVMGGVLGIVYRCIATHLIKKAGFSRRTAQTGAVTLIQRFDSALNLNVQFAVHGCTNATGAWMRRSGPHAVPRRGLRRAS